MIREIARVALLAGLPLLLAFAGCASTPDPRPTLTVPQAPVVEPLEIEGPIDSTGITSITEEQERQVAGQ
jgi:hypothetical protein